MHNWIPLFCFSFITSIARYPLIPSLFNNRLTLEGATVRIRCIPVACVVVTGMMVVEVKDLECTGGLRTGALVFTVGREFTGGLLTGGLAGLAGAEVEGVLVSMLFSSSRVHFFLIKST